MPYTYTFDLTPDELQRGASTLYQPQIALTNGISTEVIWLGALNWLLDEQEAVAIARRRLTESLRWLLGS